MEKKRKRLSRYDTRQMQADRFVDRGNWCKWKINIVTVLEENILAMVGPSVRFIHYWNLVKPLLLKYIRLRFSAHGKYSICTFVKPNRLLRWINTTPPRQWHQLANTRPDSSIFRSVPTRFRSKIFFLFFFSFSSTLGTTPAATCKF